MRKPRGNPDLAEKTLGSKRGRQLRPQDFDRDTTAVTEVIGAINRRHTAATDLPIDRVTLGQRILQGNRDFDHEGRIPRRPSPSQAAWITPRATFPLD